MPFGNQSNDRTVTNSSHTTRTLCQTGQTCPFQLQSLKPCSLIIVILLAQTEIDNCSTVWQSYGTFSDICRYDDLWFGIFAE